MKNSIKKINILILSLLFMFPALIFFGVAYGDDENNYYYSIHLASFKKLINANNFVNSLAKKGKTIFWKKKDVPGKGEFYRVYLGKYKNRDDAVAFWNVLKEEGAVSYFGVHRFLETPPLAAITEEKDISEPKGEKKEIVSPSITAPIKERFVDNKDGTITDRKTNLMWTKNGWRLDFFSALKYNDAIKKVEDFSLGGYKDWRLPTINEWKSLLDKEKQYPAITEPNPFENIIVHSPYWSKTEFNPGLIASSKSSFRAYTIMLYYGRINHQNVNKRAFVMPVRTIQ